VLRAIVLMMSSPASPIPALSSITLDAATPGRAVLALQAVMFDTVAIALDKIDEAEYAMLVSAMRLISPASRLLCLPVA